MRRYGLIALLALSQGCGDIPKDSRETLKRAKAGEVLRVAYSPAHPWVGDAAGPAGPDGIEPDLVRAWARQERVRLSWVKGSESELVEAVAENDADLMVAGLLSNSAHGPRLGTTQPYARLKIVLGAAPGAAVPEKWDRVPVRYDRRRPSFAAAIARAGAIPVPADRKQLRPFAAVYEPEVRALGLQNTGQTLRTEKLVMAGTPAENALVLSLDRFLHSYKGAIPARLAAEAGR